MKHCKRCGCLLDEDHEDDICECCLDDLLGDTNKEEEEYANSDL